MTEYKVSQLVIYPVKSLGGISLRQSEVTDRGFKYDRRWMLVDGEGNFISQRTHPVMALLQPSLNDKYLTISHKLFNDSQLDIPLNNNDYSTGRLTQVYMWNEAIQTKECNSEYNDWFSEILKVKCRLVYMPDVSQRKVDPVYARNNEVTSLSDGYPFLIIGLESLNLLNSKLDEPLPMNRFRPNIVFSGGKPHDEDSFGKFSIGNINFEVVKPCARCTVTTVDQDTGTKSDEPLRTLSSYRKVGNKIMFGQNLIHTGNGEIRVGDLIIPAIR